jgi:hypothetical protein
MEITIVTSEPQAVDPDEIADLIINAGEEGRYAVASVRVIDREGIQADRVWHDGNFEPAEEVHSVTLERDPSGLELYRPQCSCGWGKAGYARPAMANYWADEHKREVAK